VPSPSSDGRWRSMTRSRRNERRTGIRADARRARAASHGTRPRMRRPTPRSAWKQRTHRSRLARPASWRRAECAARAQHRDAAQTRRITGGQDARRLRLRLPTIAR
jgi:hypothetical protein